MKKTTVLDVPQAASINESGLDWLCFAKESHSSSMEQSVRQSMEQSLEQSVGQSPRTAPDAPSGLLGDDKKPKQIRGSLTVIRAAALFLLEQPNAPEAGLALFRKTTRTSGNQPFRHHEMHNQTQRSPHRIGSVSQNHQDEQKPAIPTSRNAQTNPTRPRRAGSVSQNHQNRRKTAIPTSRIAQSNPTQPTPDWLCFAKSPLRAEASQSAVTKRTNKPNCTEPRTELRVY